MVRFAPKLIFRVVMYILLECKLNKSIHRCQNCRKVPSIKAKIPAISAKITSKWTKGLAEVRTAVLVLIPGSFDRLRSKTVHPLVPREIKPFKHDIIL